MTEFDDLPAIHIPPIKPYDPDIFTIFNVTRLNAQGFTRTQIAKKLNITKSAVLWTMIKADLKNINCNSETDEVIFVDDWQFKVYKKFDRPQKSVRKVAHELNIFESDCEEIILELQRLHALNYNPRNEYPVLQLDCNLVQKYKRKTNVRNYKGENNEY